MRRLGGQAAKLGTHISAASSAVATKLSDLAAGRRRGTGALSSIAACEGCIGTPCMGCHTEPSQQSSTLVTHTWMTVL